MRYILFSILCAFVLGYLVRVYTYTPICLVKSEFMGVNRVTYCVLGE